MDSSSPEVALLSIHPQFAEAILVGEKRVEFRRKGFSRPIRFVAIYATQPIGKVVGWFEVDGVDCLSPQELWNKFHKCGGINEDDFRNYFADRETGFAIRVGKAARLRKAKELATISGSATPPQSFSYLTPQHARKLFTIPAVSLD